MEIARIDEAKQNLISKEVKLRRLNCKVCIYYPDIICTAPRLQFRICRACPRAANYIRKNVVRSIFEYIKSFAISLVKSMNIQLSK